jgi:hypothetical protein
MSEYKGERVDSEDHPQRMDAHYDIVEAGKG